MNTNFKTAAKNAARRPLAKLAGQNPRVLRNTTGKTVAVAAFGSSV